MQSSPWGTRLKIPWRSRGRRGPKCSFSQETLPGGSTTKSLLKAGKLQLKERGRESPCSCSRGSHSPPSAQSISRAAFSGAQHLLAPPPDPAVAWPRALGVTQTRRPAVAQPGRHKQPWGLGDGSATSGISGFRDSGCSCTPAQSLLTLWGQVGEAAGSHISPRCYLAMAEQLESG